MEKLHIFSQELCFCWKTREFEKLGEERRRKKKRRKRRLGASLLSDQVCWGRREG